MVKKKTTKKKAPLKKTSKKTVKKTKASGRKVSPDIFKDKRIFYVAIIAVVIILVGLRMSTFTMPAGTAGQTDVVTQQGSGPEIAAGDTIKLEYVGTLDDGEQFDSGELEFVAGSGQMIDGFDEAVLGMMEGGEKTFTIPPEKAYGQPDPSKMQEVPLTRTIDKIIAITTSEFEQVLGESPAKGETYNNDNMLWPIKVLSVSGDNVTIEYMAEEGGKIDYPYGTETVHLKNDNIDMVLSPIVGSNINTATGVIKIASAESDTMVLDFNHPLAGKSLTFTVKITDVTGSAEATGDAAAEPSGDVCDQLGITKSDTPSVEVFIMSYCPYGLQMQKAALPAMELLGEDADFSIKWVSYIMHGKKEIDENNVQECIQSEYADKYVTYATCFTASDDTEGCMTQAGIDSSVIDSCISDLDEEFSITDLYNDQSTWSNGRYPQYPVHAAENAQYGVRGSPATVINGKLVSVNRSPEAVKQAVCCAFNTAPSACSQLLSSAPASPGIGGGTGTTTTGECG